MCLSVWLQCCPPRWVSRWPRTCPRGWPSPPPWPPPTRWASTSTTLQIQSVPYRVDPFYCPSTHSALQWLTVWSKGGRLSRRLGIIVLELCVTSINWLFPGFWQREVPYLRARQPGGALRRQHDVRWILYLISHINVSADHGYLCPKNIYWIVLVILYFHIFIRALSLLKAPTSAFTFKTLITNKTLEVRRGLLRDCETFVNLHLKL